MATIEQANAATAAPPELRHGDRMSQAEFHRIYAEMPEDFKAELIGGVVQVASPLKLPHGTHHVKLTAVIAAFEGNSPGLQAADNTTLILAPDDEPQPDLFLRVLPEYGGQSYSTPNQYAQGAPELVAEIADSSRIIDANDKLPRYRLAGVIEYLLVDLHEQRVRWFDLRAGDEIAADAQGVFHSRIFPGLWLHGPALFAGNYQLLMATVHQGLATPEHAAFVQHLAAQRKP